MKILIIGGGNMGQSFAKSFLHNHISDIENFSVIETNVATYPNLEKLGIKNIYHQPDTFIEKFDLIVLAVKPQNFEGLSQSLQGFISSDQVVLSIMAGISIQTIQEHLHIKKIIRAMPNLSAQIGMGMTVFTSSDSVSRIELVTVQNLLESTGKNLYVSNENLIDAGTAISGSGPAYVLYFMQTMMESAKDLGFTTSQAEMLTSQTFKGIVEFYQNSNENFTELIKKVSSKGGTTEAAFNVFEENKVNVSIQDAIMAAYNRAVELGTK